MPPERLQALRRLAAVWTGRHGQVALEALGRLWRAPLASLMTLSVIAITLALPAGLYLLLAQVQGLAQTWDGGASLSLYLKPQLDDATAERLAGRLRADPAVAEVTLIGRRQAMEEFRRFSGFGEALDALDRNPLPAVLVLRPAAEATTPEGAQRLLLRLQQLPQVDLAQLDLAWVQRFRALMGLARRAALLAGGILGLAVILVVGNTIRLEIQNRRPEIEVAKLVGATDGFIRRPFLYTGLWFGLLGGLLAWALVALALALLAPPVRHLAGLYESDFALHGPGVLTGLLLLLGGCLLGLGGAWLAVARHLSDIEPK